MMSLIAAAALFASPVQASEVIAEAHFDTDSEGWRVVPFNQEAGLPAVAANGAIHALDAADGDTWYFSAPADFVDQARDGDVLEFALKDKGRGGRDAVAMQAVQIVGGAPGQAVLTAYLAVAAPAGAQWTEYEVALDGSESWWLSNGRIATPSEVAYIVNHLYVLNIQAEYVNGADHASLDYAVLSVDSQ